MGTACSSVSSRDLSPHRQLLASHEVALRVELHLCLGQENWYWQLSQNVLLWLSGYQGSSWFFICIQYLSTIFSWILLQWSFKTPTSKPRANLKPPQRSWDHPCQSKENPPLKKALKWVPCWKKKILIDSLFPQLDTKEKLPSLKDGAISGV